MGDSGGAKVEHTLDDVASFSRSLPSYFRSISFWNIGAIIGRVLMTAILLALIVRFRRTNIRKVLKNQFLGIALALPICAFIMVGVGEHWSQRTGIYKLLFNYMPFFSYQRVPGKIFGLVAIIIVVLSAIFFESVMKSAKSTEFSQLHQQALRWIGVALLAAMVAQPIEYFWIFKSTLHSMELTRLDAGPNQILPIFTAMRSLKT